jgi:erythromycin esterase-like protein
MNTDGLHPLDAIRASAIRLDDNDGDYDALLDATASCSIVMLGGATRGTAEFAHMRDAITRRLIVEQGFDAVAVEADWPDAWRVHRYVCGDSHDADAGEALGDFAHFPGWPWRNTVAPAFIEWLQRYNALRDPVAKVGFHGLDSYSLYRSARAAIRCLEQIDPEQAELAREHYAVLDHVRDPQRYGYEAAASLQPACREAVLRCLTEQLAAAPAYPPRDGYNGTQAPFFAARQAQAVASAAAYYQSMLGTRQARWNLREYHMTQTLFALQAHLRECGRPGRIVVWSHNASVGDARGTQAGHAGEWSMGQLARKRAGAAAMLVGFTTSGGQLCAAHAWDGEPERMALRSPRTDSYEALFRRTRLERFYLPLHGASSAVVRRPMLQRSVGVLYRPDAEFECHYVSATLAQQFDAVFHLDQTTELPPLPAGWSGEAGDPGYLPMRPWR